MKKIIKIILLLILSNCSRNLDTFQADLGRETSPFGEIRLPYADIYGYFGFAKPTNDNSQNQLDPKTTLTEARAFYVYLWLPQALPELGLRLISPVPKSIEPSPRDAGDDNFEQNYYQDPKSFFDAWMRIERCPTIAMPEVVNNQQCSQWVKLAENDDSKEMPDLPNGIYGNCLMRVASINDDPLKSISRGLYRIAIGADKNNKLFGSFLLQVGAPVELNGLAMARSTEELHKIITK
ncbi:MAG: hypothetical protein JW841_08360 [Deltaproteobacteria bacterium]|nr:hypothetical protein [Deltaproteobacteria bacterium]